MKFLGLVIVPLLLLFLPVVAWAQLESQSDVVETRIGNPPDLPQTTPGQRQAAPPCPSDCRSAVLEQFGITVSTAFPPVFSEYVWNKMWDVSHTNFDDLVWGTYVERDDSGSRRVGNTIYLRGSYTPPFFDVIFVHEMGHVINDMDDTLSFRSAHRDTWYDEGGLTGYGATACLYGAGATDDAKVEEDYADMIAYYLNPGVPDQTTGRCDWGIVPFAGGANPRYFELAQDILGVY